MRASSRRETFANARMEVLPDQEARRNSVVEAQSRGRVLNQIRLLSTKHRRRDISELMVRFSDKANVSIPAYFRKINTSLELFH